MEMFI